MYVERDTERQRERERGRERERERETERERERERGRRRGKEAQAVLFSPLSASCRSLHWCAMKPANGPITFMCMSGNEDCYVHVRNGWQADLIIWLTALFVVLALWGRHFNLATCRQASFIEAGLCRIWSQDCPRLPVGHPRPCFVLIFCSCRPCAWCFSWRALLPPFSRAWEAKLSTAAKGPIPSTAFFSTRSTSPLNETAGALKTALEPLDFHLHVVDREPGVRPRGPCIKSMEDALVLPATVLTFLWLRP